MVGEQLRFLVSGIHMVGGDCVSEALPWHPHSAFEGVFLKHLLAGDASGQCLSSHLVRIDAWCRIGRHVHKDQWEQHYVLSGNGQGDLDGRMVVYEPGALILIPKMLPHAVSASSQPLYLLATFTPALS